MIIKFAKLKPNAKSPTKANPTDSGFDLYTCEQLHLYPGETAIVPTGIAVELPTGYEAQVRPRSGISAKTGLLVMLGTIDNQFRGEIGIIVKNVGPEIEIFDIGAKLAQLVPVKLDEFFLEEVETVCNNTTRGASGFGSSGI